VEKNEIINIGHICTILCNFTLKKFLVIYAYISDKHKTDVLLTLT